MLDFNFINVNLDKDFLFRKKTKLRCITRFIFQLNNDAEYFVQEDYILAKQIKTEIENISHTLYFYQVELKNCGNSILKESDFYQNSKLKVDCCDFLVGFVDTVKTKDYVNAKILKQEKSEYYISFDELKPNDSIFLNFISNEPNSEELVDSFGETRFFKKPITNNEFYENIVKIILFILLISFFIRFFFLFVDYQDVQRKTNVLKEYILNDK